MKRFRYDPATVVTESVVGFDDQGAPYTETTHDYVYKVFDGPIEICTTQDSSIAEWIVEALTAYAENGG